MTKLCFLKMFSSWKTHKSFGNRKACRFVPMLLCIAEQSANLHGAFMTLGYPSQVHPFQTHPKTSQNLVKSWNLWGASENSASLNHRPVTPSSPKTHGWKTHIGWTTFFWVGGCLEVFVVPARVRFWIFFSQIQESGGASEAIRLTGKTHLWIWENFIEKALSPQETAGICKCFSTLGTVHPKVWRTFSQDGDSASYYETQTTYFGALIICLSITQNCPQWYLNNILSDLMRWQKLLQLEKNGARQDVSFNCLAHLQKNNADVLSQDVSATASASFSRRKASKTNIFPSWNSPHGVVCSRSS